MFFKTTRAKVGHVGMYLTRGRFHPRVFGGRQCDDLVGYDKYYFGPRFRGGVRIPKLVKG